MFRKEHRKKVEPMDLDITSLLDILVILLVFLLKSYNASNLKLDIVKDLTVPVSEARKLGNHSLIVQVDKDNNVWMKRKMIGTIEDSTQKLDFLYSALAKERQMDGLIKEKNKSINLVFDKQLPYMNLKKVMHTSALAGYSEFKLLVQGNY